MECNPGSPANQFESALSQVKTEEDAALDMELDDPKKKELLYEGESFQGYFSVWKSNVVKYEGAEPIEVRVSWPDGQGETASLF